MLIKNGNVKGWFVMLKKFCVLSLIIGLSACSTVPKSIQVGKEKNLVNYSEVKPETDTKEGEWVRWGGIIAEVKNNVDSTTIEMVQLPLRNYGRPIETSESGGRFRVNVEGFLDPIVFSEGRSVTFAGQLEGVEEGSIGEYVYKFPVVNSEGYELWEEVRPVDVARYNAFPYGFYPYGFVGGRHFIGHGFGRRGFGRFGNRGFGHRGFGFRGGRGAIRTPRSTGVRRSSSATVRGGATSRSRSISRTSVER
jgi:outer membrane lipoprotein